MKYMWLFSIISIVPLLFYLIDGYIEKRLRRGVIQIAAFLVVGGVVIGLLKVLGLIFIVYMPFAILFFVFLKKVKAF